MIPCLYNANETIYQTNGIGKLADCISCVVTEQRNGSFELKMEYPEDGIHAEDLIEGNIILARPAEQKRSQPFRIYKVTTPLSGILDICARHISYQLNYITVSPVSAVGCRAALQALKNAATTDCPFEFITDIESSASFAISEPVSLRNALGGIEGSVLDTFGGEYEWDRDRVFFYNARGSDHGVRIVYGKNLIDFTMEKNIEDVITGIHPYWKGEVDGENVLVELSEKIVTINGTVNYQKIIPLDCSGEFEEQPTQAQLRSFANSYLKNTAQTEPDLDIDIDFAQLWQLPGYEDIAEAERVSLCDTVHVYISKLGVEVSSKVTETQYDVLLERYKSITLSNSRISARNSSLAVTLSEIGSQASEAAGVAATAVKAATEATVQVMRQGVLYMLGVCILGLHCANGTDDSGDDVSYAYNASTLQESSYAWKYTKSGLYVSYNGGRTWQYGWTSDGKAVATIFDETNVLDKLDKRYKTASDLSTELWSKLNDLYAVAKNLSDELWIRLDDRYSTANDLSLDLWNRLDGRYSVAKDLSEDLWARLNDRFGTATALSEELWRELDDRYGGS